jgi:hypothetical protein
MAPGEAAPLGEEGSISQQSPVLENNSSLLSQAENVWMLQSRVAVDMAQ